MSADHITVPLRRVAHSRSGDKGDRSNISVIAWHDDLWPLIVEQVTVDRIDRLFAFRAPTAITRYVLPRIQALNIVLDGALDGGVNDSLNLDSHGKALSFLLLSLPIRVPLALERRLVGVDETPSQPLVQETP